MTNRATPRRQRCCRDLSGTARSSTGTRGRPPDHRTAAGTSWRTRNPGKSPASCARSSGRSGRPADIAPLASYGRASIRECLPGQQRPHEGPFVAQDAAAVVPDAVRFDEVRVGAEPGAVLLIGGQAEETKQRQGLVARALARQEVAVVRAA